MPKQYWLMKSEPDVFSFTDLLKAKGKRTCWDGVRNYQARNFMRDTMKKGDGVLFYHSNAKPPGIAGVAEVVKEGYPDHTAFDPKDSHFDPKSDPDAPTWMMVDIKAKKTLPKFLAMDDLKAAKKLAKMAVVQKGQRLSVQPVTSAEWATVLAMGGLPKD